MAIPTPVFLPGEFHGQKTLVGYSPWDCRESDRTERLTLSLFIIVDVEQINFIVCHLFLKCPSPTFSSRNLQLLTTLSINLSTLHRAFSHQYSVSIRMLWVSKNRYPNKKENVLVCKTKKSRVIVKFQIKLKALDKDISLQIQSLISSHQHSGSLFSLAFELS